MHNQEFWAIRHKQFGEFMPARIAGQTRGWSHWTPAPVYAEQRLRAAPRLFETERAAKNALTCWLQGEWSAIYETESDWESGYKSTYVAGTAPGQPQVPRRAEDMEIVQVRLEVRA